MFETYFFAPVIFCPFLLLMFVNIVTMIQNSKIRKIGFIPTWFTAGYLLFTASGILLWLLSKDMAIALGNFGIALAFDPFDQKMKWNDRPLYQKALLIAHVTVLFAGLIYMTFLKK